MAIGWLKIRRTAPAGADWLRAASRAPCPPREAAAHATILPEGADERQAQNYCANLLEVAQGQP